MSEDEERECPYCGVVLGRPYYKHLQKDHPEEYNKKVTWIQLYQDYKSMGMDSTICLTVIGELFNSDPKEVKLFLERHDAF